ncbi:MAG: ferredoxin [Magnetococcales bacterium]|nr:ferredoxin [Magnetococcales bacterium]|tara:strand:- start:72 stop:383 length:312 start_codon:yes stop_codon:yes gene_type:complete
MAKLIFKTSEGDKETVLNKGERVLAAAYKLGLDADGFGECGGNCVCSTCHVFVEKGLELFPESTPAEEDLLDTVFTYQENSRLACQLMLKEETDEVIIELPSA